MHVPILSSNRVNQSGERAKAAYCPHLEDGATLVHDRENSHNAVVRERHLVSEAYDSRVIKRLPDEENPLAQVNLLCYLLRLFLDSQCTNAHYQLNSAMPWYDTKASLRTCEFLGDVSVPIVSMDYWFYNDAALTGVSGWENVGGLASLRQTFSGCSRLSTLDLTGLNPSSLKDLFYAFASCTNLTTILVDATWELPASGVSGMNTFYNDWLLVGGNGTTYSSGDVGYAWMVVDRAG